MLLSFGLLGVAFARTECNGSKYSPLGCFTDDPPFSVPGYRPARMPESVKTVNPKFTLTNKLYTDSSINWQNVPNSRFQTGKPVVVLTHGWNDDYDDRSFIADARDNFKRYKDVNFLALDWSGGSKQLDYPLAAANTQVAGRSIAYLFNQLKSAGFRNSDFHCAGHSLGSHVCSYAAKYAKSEFQITLGRVTGLDAAGPLFEKADTAVRIDKSDATYVDLIHSNGGNEDDGFLGINRACGHADFFPNGGHQQPGCGSNNFICAHGVGMLQLLTLD